MSEASSSTDNSAQICCVCHSLTGVHFDAGLGAKVCNVCKPDCDSAEHWLRKAHMPLSTTQVPPEK